MDGCHIKVLGRGSPGALGDQVIVREFVRELADRLELRMLDEPQVDVRDEDGVTVTVALSTGHIALHTWPRQAEAVLAPMFVLDVFSCHPFDDEAVGRLLVARLYTHGHAIHDLTHTLDYMGYRED